MLNEGGSLAERTAEAIENVATDLDAFIERIRPIRQDVLRVVVGCVTDGREHSPGQCFLRNLA